MEQVLAEKKLSESEQLADRSYLFGFHIDKMSLEQCVHYLDSIIRSRQKLYIVLVNAAKIVKARRDPHLARIIQEAHFVGADGVPIVWASRILRQPLPGRINGTDLMDRLIVLAAEKGHRVYFLGAKEEVIANAVDLLKETHPGLQVAGFRHGYFKTAAEEKAVVADISASGADILLVGMSTPMKEEWVRRNFKDLDVSVIHGVGGSFDILGGLTKRAPEWMQETGLEWFYRLLQEPKRMWKRYLVTNTIYVGLVMKEFIFMIFRIRKVLRFQKRMENEKN